MATSLQGKPRIRQKQGPSYTVRARLKPGAKCLPQLFSRSEGAHGEANKPPSPYVKGHVTVR
ncbi:hypothetical protein MGG_17332 [Pyricularia oryzae 70-15]|uniref:Uncharacterized protein n=3 Tax=Pyricularia oryzae TaxID=318829 RepID=G4ND32_PYRO7|nr:uncharacterized protein MGG_17332 [Pyricularia oryzae 70-15]EHA48374.1 hypothetical protein MGG_17332 [Pyricularia oryzae 70-15]ELQ40083.1 hypothetical protein OOU_Y34scaffold00462g37 [Pyricularia oryzae Y34]